MNSQSRLSSATSISEPVSFYTLLLSLFLFLSIIAIASNSSYALDSKQIDKLAYLANAQAVIVREPATLAQVATLTEILNSQSSIDKTSIVNGFISARTSFSDWYTTSSGSDFTSQVKMFADLNTALRQHVDQAPRHVLNAYTDILEPTYTLTNIDASWRSIRSEKTQLALEAFYETCRQTVAHARICDEAMSPVFGVSVSDTYDTICAHNENLGGCDLLPNATYLTESDVRNIFREHITMIHIDITNALKGDNDTDADQKKKIDRYKGIVSTIASLSHLIGLSDTVTNDMKTLGTSTIDIYANVTKLISSFSKIDPIMLTQVTDWSQWKNYLFGDSDKCKDLSNTLDVLTGIGGSINSISEAVTNILKLFSDHAPTIDEQILDHIKQVEEMIKAMQENMNSRFDVLDSKLDTLYVAMVDGLAAINNREIAIEDAINQVNTSLAHVQSDLITLSINIESYLSDLSRQDLDWIIGLETNISRSEFNREEAFLYNWIINTINDTLHAGPDSRDYHDNIFSELSHSMSYNINYLSNYPLEVFGLNAISSSRLANPTDLTYGGQLYASLLNKYPSFVKDASETIKKHIMKIKQQRIVPIRSAIAGIQGNSELFDKLVADYKAKISVLQKTINDNAALFLQDISSIGHDLSQFDIWGTPDQLVDYIPSAIKTSKIQPCTGYGASLDIPSGWKSLFPARTAFNAEALGLVQNSACYEVGDPTVNGGWSDWEAIPNGSDVWWAWAVLNIKINIYLSGVGQTNTFVIGRNLQIPQTYSSWGDKICFYWLRSESDDPIWGAPQLVPARPVVSAAWEGNWHGNGWCENTGAAVSQLRNAFNTLSTVTWDWGVGQPAKKSVIDTAINNRFTELQRQFYNYIAQQLKSTSDVGDAAKQVTGAKLAILNYLQLGFPELLRNNNLIHSLFFGASPLPDRDSLQMLYASTASMLKLPSRIDFTDNANKAISNLQVIIETEIQRIAGKESNQSIIYLDALETQLDLLYATNDFQAQSISNIDFEPFTLSVGDTVIASATATSGLPVTFKSITPKICKTSGDNGSVVSAVHAGTCKISGDQSGNNIYAPAPQVTVSLAVGKADQSISSITLNPSSISVGGTAKASASSTSGLAVSFSTLTPGVCTTSGSNGRTVTAVASGACTIAAHQPGNADYNPAPQVVGDYTITPLLPDLVVTNIVPSPISPVANSVLDVRITVKNKGKAISYGGELTVWTDQPTAQSCSTDGDKSISVGELTPGESRIFTINALPVGDAGSKMFRAFVDSGCTVEEPDETNNQLTAGYSVTEPPLLPDFVVTSISLTPVSPTQNGKFDAAVTIKNQGAAAGNPRRLTVWANRTGKQKCNADGGKSTSLSSIAKGASKTVTIKGIPAGSKGTKTLRAFVDSSCATRELEEDNNQFTKSYKVRE